MKLSKSAREQAEGLEEVVYEILDPKRRSFLRRGSIVAIAAASIPVIGSALTSCSDDPVTSTDESKARDISMISDAYLLEKLAVNTYVAAAGLLSGAYLAVGTSFADDHNAHAATFSTILTGSLGATLPTGPAANENLFTGMTVNGATKFKIIPTIPVTDAISVFRYALGVELTAAQMYLSNATNDNSMLRLSNKAAAEAMVDIAPVEAEHAAVFRAALKLLENVPTDRDFGAMEYGSSIQPTYKLSQETPKP